MVDVGILVVNCWKDFVRVCFEYVFGFCVIDFMDDIMGNGLYI